MKNTGKKVLSENKCSPTWTSHHCGWQSLVQARLWLGSGPVMDAAVPRFLDAEEGTLMGRYILTGFLAPEIWSEGSQGKGDNATEPLLWGLFSLYFIYIKKNNSSSLSFWTSIFSLSEVKISTHLYCSLRSPEHNFLYCKKKKWGEERKHQGRIEMQKARKASADASWICSHSREAGDKVA